MPNASQTAGPPASRSMRLHVAGAGPAYSDRPRAAGASYLLRSGDAAVVLDMGQGAFANIASTIEPSGISAVLVSHLHPDHFIDLVPLRHYLRYEFQPRRRIAVFGPAGLADRLDAVNGDPGFAAAALDVSALDALPGRIGPFLVESAPVTHDDGSVAFRVSAADGGGVVYSGDCGRAEDLLPLIRAGDTLLCECSFGPGPVPVGALHLTSADAARVATEGGASRLLLTHLQIGFDRASTLTAARAVFDGPVTLVTEGDEFTV